MMYLAYLYSGGGNITQAYVSEQGWVRTNSISCHTHIDRHIVRHLPVVILEAYVAVHTSSLTCDMLLLFLLPSDNVQHDLQLGITHTFPEKRKKTSRNKRKPMHQAYLPPVPTFGLSTLFYLLYVYCCAQPFWRGQHRRLTLGQTPLAYSSRTGSVCVTGKGPSCAFASPTTPWTSSSAICSTPM